MTAARASPSIGRRPEPRPNIITLIRDILGNSSLPGNARTLGVQLALGAGLDGVYFGGVETMAQKAGWSKPTTERALAILVRKQICQREIRPLGPDGGTHNALTIFRWSHRWRETDERGAETLPNPKPVVRTNSRVGLHEQPNPSLLMESLIRTEKTTSLEASDPCSGVFEKPEAPRLAWLETGETLEPVAVLSKLLQDKFPGVDFDCVAIQTILRNLGTIPMPPALFVERLARKRESGYQPSSWVAFAIAFSRTPVPYRHCEVPKAVGSLYTQTYRKYDPAEDE
jgi:hypothetical protein